MKIDSFYSFRSKLLTSTLQVHAINLPKTGYEHVDIYLRLLTGDYTNIDFPLIFNKADGRKIMDIVDTGTGFVNLISDRFKEILELNGFTGYQTFPVKILLKNNIELSSYHGLSVTGKCGPIDYSKSAIVERANGVSGKVSKWLIGKHIRLDKWDGTDFFLPEDNYGIIVTKRVYDILIKEKITNCDMENLATWDIWEYSLRNDWRKKLHFE